MRGCFCLRLVIEIGEKPKLKILYKSGGIGLQLLPKYKKAPKNFIIISSFNDTLLTLLQIASIAIVPLNYFFSFQVV